MSAYVEQASGSGTIAFEATADPRGVNGWKALPFRQLGDGTYAATPVALSGGAVSLYFDPADNVCHIRAVVAGTPVSLYAVLTAER